MRFGIEEINNSSALLPNVTLGYELYDVCSESANVYATLSILSKAGTGYVDIQENPALYSPKTVAVIGPDTTSRAATTAGLLGPFLVPLVPTSVCSSDCPEGHQRVIMSFHHCCFECVPCEAGTFLNESDPYSCQPCGKEEWAPERSQTCFPRTVVFLTWHEPISWVLLAANTMLLLLVAGTAGLFAWYLDTPVVRSAGGRMCFLMLGSLAGGSCGLYGFFGEPMLPTCLLRQGLFALGFAIFLSCLIIRSFQLVFIFKFSAKMPTFFHAWVQNHGAGLFVVISSITQLLICLVWLAVWTPLPTREYQRFPQLVVLDCTEANSLGLRLAFTYNGLLSVSAFACSYLGKDLPENYNEAKCVTFSLLLNFVSWITFFTVASVYQGKYLAAVNVFAMLSSLSGGFSGYFLPKCYIILCRPDLNSTEHFQASIQDYSRRCGST